MSFMLRSRSSGAVAQGFASLLLAFSSVVAWAQLTVPANVIVQSGYSVRALAVGLDFPTALAVSGNRVWVAEGGFLPGFAPKVKEITAAGSVSTLLSGDMLPAGKLSGPLTDVTFHDGELWITHRQMGANGWLVGAISEFMPADPIGTFHTVITNLPSAGDHYTEEIVFGTDGRAYFSQGSATNSSVVGADNFGWLKTPSLQGFHDFPPVDITLDGRSFKTFHQFPLDPTATKITAPYMPFGSGPIAAGTIIHAATPATPQQGMVAGNGTVYSFDPNASDPVSTLRLEGWGFRNPYGIGFDPFHSGSLFVSNNGADTRSMKIGPNPVVVESRPIEHDFDDMFVLHPGGTPEFFGWPDFFHDPKTGAVLPVTAAMFCEQSELHFPCPPFVLASAFRNSLVTQPAFAEFDEHSSANKFDFSTDSRFGFPGDIFVAETGSFPPITGADEFTGYRVVHVSRSNGKVTNFIKHRMDTPAVLFDPAGFNKPIDVKFSSDQMLIADLGVFEPGLSLVGPKTGKIWVVSRVSADVNHDGRVDCADVAIVQAAFGKRSGQPGFDARADLNGDGQVDISDLRFVLANIPAGVHCGL